jgi:hypothetical protein
MKKHTITLIIFYFSYIYSSAQILNFEFGRRYGGTKSDPIGTGLPDKMEFRGLFYGDGFPDSSFVFTCNSDSKDFFLHSNNGQSDLWVVKVNSNGDTLYSKNYGSTGEDIPYQTLAMADGGCLICGNSLIGNLDFRVPFRSSSDSSTAAGFLMRLDNEGNKVFIKRYGGDGGDRFHGVARTQDKGYIIAGYSNSNTLDLANAVEKTGRAWLLKTDSLGNMQWNTRISCKDTLPSSRDEVFFRTLELPDGQGYIAAGSATYDKSNKKNDDFFVARFSTTGQLMWKKKFGYPLHDFLQTLLLTPEGKIWVSGRKYSTASIFYGDFWVRSMNLDGSTEWDKIIAGDFSAFVFDIKPFTHNRYILVGGLYSYGASVFAPSNNRDGWVSILDSAANIKANFIGGGSNIDYFQAFAILPDKQKIMTVGVTGSLANPFCPDAPYNPNVNDRDGWVTKIRIIDTSTTSIHQALYRRPEIVLYPSPAQYSFSVLSDSHPAHAQMLDAQGRMVKEFDSVSCAENRFLVSDLPRGIYTIRMDYDDGPVFRKMVLE